MEECCVCVGHYTPHKQKYGESDRFILFRMDKSETDSLSSITITMVLGSSYVPEMVITHYVPEMVIKLS